MNFSSIKKQKSLYPGYLKKIKPSRSIVSNSRFGTNLELNLNGHTINIADEFISSAFSLYKEKELQSCSSFSCKQIAINYRTIFKTSLETSESTEIIYTPVGI
jgi:hypothetical protein